jgi:LEA14-like dessication related protein
MVPANGAAVGATVLTNQVEIGVNAAGITTLKTWLQTNSTSIGAGAKLQSFTITDNGYGYIYVMVVISN